MANFTTDAAICIERELCIDVEYPATQDLKAQFDIENTCKWISENKFETVCLQFPDELLSVSANIYEEIKKCTDVDLYILGDTSYASCCVDSVAAMHVQGDAVIHYGRSCFSTTDIPTFIVLPKRSLNVAATMDAIKTNWNSDENTKLVLFYDLEFDHCRGEIAKSWFGLFPNSYIAFIEKEEHSNRFLGRVIQNSSGEEFSQDVTKDCICIYVGSRGQTVFNYSVSIEASQWYCVDPSSPAVQPLSESSWLSRRRHLVERCRDARAVGALVCRAAGPRTRRVLARVQQLSRAAGKRCYIVAVGKPNVAKLANFPEIDIYVMIACPENELYSSRDFYQPIVYPFELEVATNANREGYFTTHVTDAEDLLPGGRRHADIAPPDAAPDVSLVTGKIRQTHIDASTVKSTDLAQRQNWALDNVGQGLQHRSWAGLEQRLGETEVKMAEKGRAGIPLQYNNEPE